jgi:hypothetical protein
MIILPLVKALLNEHLSLIFLRIIIKLCSFMFYYFSLCQYLLCNLHYIQMNMLLIFNLTITIMVLCVNVVKIYVYLMCNVEYFYVIYSRIIFSYYYPHQKYSPYYNPLNKIKFINYII